MSFQVSYLKHSCHSFPLNKPILGIEPSLPDYKTGVLASITIRALVSDSNVNVRIVEGFEIVALCGRVGRTVLNPRIIVRSKEFSEYAGTELFIDVVLELGLLFDRVSANIYGLIEVVVRGRSMDPSVRGGDIAAGILVESVSDDLAKLGASDRFLALPVDPQIVKSLLLDVDEAIELLDRLDLLPETSKVPLSSSPLTVGLEPFPLGVMPLSTPYSVVTLVVQSA